ncbi:MAG: HAD family hydrolase [Acidobacteriaceae bacterium]|nr:HAD family hydrolase [Acidobacteriaceae bacterium]
MIPSFPVYLFDVDGTLVDSALDICGAIQGVLASTHQNEVPFELLKGYIGRHLNDLFTDLFPDYRQEQINHFIEEYRRLYPARKHAATKVYPGVKAVLSQLPGKKATATTKGTPTTRLVLEMFELLPYFDHVQGTDGFPAKPNPDVIYKALEALGAATTDCLFVGDSMADMEAARRAGVRSCAVTWGYGKREHLARWKPDYWIDDLSELLPSTALSAPVEEELRAGR